VLKATIQEQLDDLVGDSEEETTMKDMLSTLLQFLT
jgi:beta-catenin-like protein 1